MIIPTIGRVLRYHPTQSDSAGGMFVPVEGYCAALVTAVWSDSCVSVVVFDRQGNVHQRQSVYLDQAETPDPSHGSAWCSWPLVPVKPTQRSDA